MDDPWGSPWATASDPASRNELAPPPSPPKALLSPPPRAFVGSASVSPSQSPWAEDGGFGEWPGTDLTQSKKNLAEWGVWGDAPLQQPQFAPKHDGSGRASPLAWPSRPSSTATSPGLKPLPRSRTSSIFRQPSPDPWAAELSMRHRRDTFSSFSLSVHEPEEDVPQLSRSNTEGCSARLAKEFKLEEDAGADTAKHETQSRVSPINTNSQNPARPTKKSTLNEIHEDSPRPSSTFSHPSSQDIDRQDSPITSIDEDSKTRLQTTSRKTSGNAQELAGRNDDITKTTAVGTPPTERREDDNVPAGFGNSEDVEQEDEVPGPNTVPTLAPSARPSTPRGHAGDTVPQTSTPKSPEVPSPLAKATSAAIEQLLEKFGPIQFDVDPIAADKLFPPVDETRNENGGHIEVPDRVITDSFASISERKAWYRMSRHGSKRKHDLGDDENYHRVMWSTSEVHGETLKIVRRWMEEDSYAGRAILGGSKRTSAFNWDSTAAPVDLNTIFGRRSSLQSRTSSIQQRNSTTSSIYSVGPPSAPTTAPRASTSSLNTSEVPSTPVAGFGWSSTITESPEMDAAVSTAKTRYSIEPPPNRSVPSTPMGRGKVSSPIQPPQPLVNKVDTMPEDDEDDDDWGEMVSSPQVGTHPSIDQIVSTPVTSQPLQSQQELPVASSVGSPVADSWAFADLSVLEAPIGSPVEQSNFSPITTPSEAELSASTTRVHPVPISPSSVHSPARVAEASPPKAVLGPIEEASSEREQEQDEVVRRIVQNLPDLSYMLR
ncbi:hypothetical protein SLS62_009698 [Diatrype stigma]|uniref:Uncharacterized protein n=1 Tax=Diatrype stigma TaxID=117547 RepID=A0AAN9UDB4_9PEZI